MGAICRVASRADQAVRGPAAMSTRTRKRPDGEATNDLILSAHAAANDEVFPQVLSLYVEPGSAVADVTYGKGVFWRRVPETAYRLLATDLETGVD